MSTEREQGTGQSERAPSVDPFAQRETREEERTTHATGDLGGGGRSHSYPESIEKDAMEKRAQPEHGAMGTAELARPAATGTTDAVSRPAETAPLLAAEDSARFEDRWRECQQSFVDEPRDAVKHADELVAEMMQKVAGQFATTRDSLEKKWAKGDEVDTEDLRLALQQYRAFFHRLLAV